jgi:hypothetical protein
MKTVHPVLVIVTIGRINDVATISEEGIPLLTHPPHRIP